MFGTLDDLTDTSELSGFTYNETVGCLLSFCSIQAQADGGHQEKS